MLKSPCLGTSASLRRSPTLILGCTLPTGSGSNGSGDENRKPVLRLKTAQGTRHNWKPPVIQLSFAAEGVIVTLNGLNRVADLDTKLIRV